MECSIGGAFGTRRAPDKRELGSTFSVVENVGPFRVYATGCHVEERYEYNRRFKVLTGERFWNDGNLQFTEYPQPPHAKFYKTCNGPAISSNAVIYDDSNKNISIAIRRLTGTRKPELPGYSALLYENQKRTFRAAADFLDTLRTKYAPYFDDYRRIVEEAIEHHADPHDKKALRIQGMANLLCGDGNVHGNWIRRNRTIWKMKTGEWAKNGKKPRMIVDLGVEASLMGFRLTNFVKVAQDSEPIHVNGGVIRFCKSPDMRVLEDVFDNLINLRHRFYFVYFSDDACLSVRMKDGSIRFYNLDISSCDSSHGPEVFEALYNIVPVHVQPDMRRLLSQCEAPLKLVNRENKKEKVLVKPIEPMLYSGWTGTTAINNLANIMIAYGISQLKDFENPDDIRRAAEQAGYIITGWEKPLDTYAKLQFLKHSPVYDTDGLLRPMLNLGVLLRASGMCNYDLPGKKIDGYEERAKRFQRGLLRGAYPRTKFELLELMTATCGEGEAYDNEYMKKKVVVEDDTYPTYSVSNLEIAKRYDLGALEHEQFVQTFGRCGFGDLYASPAVEKILKADYDLGCRYRECDSFIKIGP